MAKDIWGMTNYGIGLGFAPVCCMYRPIQGIPKDKIRLDIGWL